jgi:tRNA 2-selenouridine synthase
MPKPLAPPDVVAALVHPHQMEIQEFAFYARVIDARAASAFEHAHLPGAVNVPVQSVQSDPKGLQDYVAGVKPGESVLIYCDRGGLDSLVLAAPLRAEGLRVDVLGGGWINYRRWVTAGLDALPRVLSFELEGTQVPRRGEQAVDLAGLIGHGVGSQDAFEGALLEVLRRLDPQRPVRVRGLPPVGSAVVLPPALRDALDCAAQSKP